MFEQTNSGLFVFDLDGTLVDEPDFYKNTYSGSLNQTVSELCGDKGLDELAFCRANFDGKGELALTRLGIPFSEWAKRLIASPIDAISAQPELIANFRKLNAPKILFTGSPLLMASRVLERVGFTPETDFAGLYGWDEPVSEPLKWFQSKTVFNDILNRFGCSPTSSWSIGDDWETDLAPALSLGMRTVQIKRTAGNPDFRFPTINAFLNFINASRGGDINVK